MVKSARAAQGALTASAGAARRVGSGPVDAVAVDCGALRMGVFFDGTGNSRRHVASVGQPGIDVNSWHTNVDLLQRLYKQNGRGDYEVAVVNGQKRKIAYFSRYMRGIGVESDGSTDGRGMGMGRGPEGVAARVEQAIDQLLEDIRARQADVQPCILWFDTFGFSRGATAARDFANGIRDEELRYGSATSRVKFMGLFDTVSSVHYGPHRGNAGNSGGVTLNTTNNVAESIFHITAKDEVRADFPLARVARGTEIGVVGAHSDIGGGYFPGMDTSTFRFRDVDFPGVLNFYKARWGGDGSRDNVESWLRIGTAGRYNLITLTTTARHGLQFVTLNLMHEKAVAAKVPLLALGDSIRGISIKMSEPLQTYLSELRSGNVSAQSERVARRVYAHFSCNNATAAAGFVRPNLPETNGVRRTTTL